MAWFIKKFAGSLIITVVALVAMALYGGVAGIVTTVLLIGIELAFSIDNAVVNAQILAKMNRFWQLLFMTVGVVIAILGMRIVFPIAIVAITAHLGFGHVIDLALHHAHTYSHYLDLAHPAISAFGGGFLLTLALYFLLDTRDVQWLSSLEKPLQKLGGHWLVAPAIAAAVIVLLALVPANHHVATTLQAGLTGVVLYVLINGMVGFLERRETAGGTKSGVSALVAFLYLMIIDASFSFDSVLGAFAISNSLIFIVVGLGVGAIWVRSLTVMMVRHKTLDTYIYLEHGAHYAILVLALALLVGIIHEVPDMITGLVGIAIIIAAFFSSPRKLR